MDINFLNPFAVVPASQRSIPVYLTTRGVRGQVLIEDRLVSKYDAISIELVG